MASSWDMGYYPPGGLLAGYSGSGLGNGVPGAYGQNPDLSDPAMAIPSLSQYFSGYNQGGATANPGASGTVGSYGGATSPYTRSYQSAAPPANAFNLAAPAANRSATVYGDGHIRDGLGGNYDFRGTGVKSLLEDKTAGLDLRGNFTAGPRGATLSEAGLTVGNRTLNVQADGTAILSGGGGVSTPLADGQGIALDNGGRVERRGNQVIVTTPGYELKLEANPQGGFLNVSATAQNPSPGRAVGMLGETLGITQSRNAVGSPYRQDELNRNGVQGSLARSRPSDGVSSLVSAMYQNVLGRPPESQQAVVQLGRLMRDGNVAGGFKQLFNADEFKRNNPTPEQKAEKLYMGILQRRPSPQETQAMTDALAKGATLDQAVDTLLQSGEYLQKVRQGEAPKNIVRAGAKDSPEAYVRSLYVNLLGRNPENDQVVQYWTDQLRQGNLGGVVRDFFNSDEMKARNLSDQQKGDLLYAAILQREPDDRGRYWVVKNLKDKGLDDTIWQMFQSEEYRKRSGESNLPGFTQWEQPFYRGLF